MDGMLIPSRVASRTRKHKPVVVVPVSIAAPEPSAWGGRWPLPLRSLSRRLFGKRKCGDTRELLKIRGQGRGKARPRGRGRGRERHRVHAAEEAPLAYSDYCNKIKMKEEVKEEEDMEGDPEDYSRGSTDYDDSEDGDFQGDQEEQEEELEEEEEDSEDEDEMAEIQEGIFSHMHANLEYFSCSNRGRGRRRGRSHASRVGDSITNEEYKNSDVQIHAPSKERRSLDFYATEGVADYEGMNEGQEGMFYQVHSKPADSSSSYLGGGHGRGRRGRGRGSGRRGGGINPSKRPLTEEHLEATSCGTKSVQVTESTDWIELSKTEPWLSSEKLVVRPHLSLADPGSCGRQRRSLAGFDLDLAEVAEFVKVHLGKEVELAEQEPPVTTFIVEPFVPPPEEFDLLGVCGESESSGSQDDWEDNGEFLDRGGGRRSRRGRGRGRSVRGTVNYKEWNDEIKAQGKREMTRRYFGKVALSPYGTLVPCRPLYGRQFGLKIDEYTRAPVPAAEDASPCRPIPTTTQSGLKTENRIPPDVAAAENPAPCQPSRQFGLNVDDHIVPAVPADKYGARTSDTIDGKGLKDRNQLCDQLDDKKTSQRAKRRRSAEKEAAAPLAAAVARGCVAARTRSRKIPSLTWQASSVKLPPVFICLDDD